MRKVMVLGTAALTLLVVAGSGAFRAADTDKPKYTIEEIMEKAHDKDSGILPKVMKGNGSKDDKQTLVELYTELGKNKPPKGEAKSWKDKTDALLAAAKSVAADEKESLPKLKKASACMDCHKLHKGD
jgi:hypothetical protein